VYDQGKAATNEGNTEMDSADHVRKRRTLRMVFVVTVGMTIMLGPILFSLDQLGYASKAQGSVSRRIVLKFANLEPGPSFFTKMFQWWATEIEKRTSGRLKIEIYSGGTLARPKSVIEAVRIGLADAGEVVAVFNPGKTPLATVGQNPIGSSDIYVNHRAMQDLINNYGPIQEEFKEFNQKTLWTQATGSQRLIAIKPIRALDELKGMKIRASAQMATLYKKLGASPVFIPMTETYEGLQRGTAEAASAGLSHMEPLRFHEVCKHLLMVEGIGVNNAGFGTINLDTWKRLPADIQTVVMEVSNEFPAYLSKNMIASEKKILEAFKGFGVKVYELGSADKKKLQEVGKQVAELWVKNMDRKGLPGTETLKVLLKAESKHQAEVEVKGYPWAKR
jgi:TRAP-type C4-dicarboxylate transport system substrate-binding protein